MVDKELTEIICTPFIQIMVHDHSNRDIVIVDYESLTSVIPICISPCQDPRTVRNVFALIFADRQTKSPVIRGNRFQMNHKFLPYKLEFEFPEIIGIRQ